jgi:uncharacterized protein YidB (DUF937 family)
VVFVTALVTELPRRESGMWWILKKSLKRLFAKRAGSLLGGLGGKELSAVAAALIGAGGAKLPALIASFKSAGLGNLIESWIGKGANQAVSGEQVKSVVGSDAISEVAAQLGIPDEQAAAKVSGLLPELIDKLTPDGSVPDEQALAKKLSALSK